MKQSSNLPFLKHVLENVTTENKDSENNSLLENENFIPFPKDKSLRPMKSMLKPKSLQKKNSYKSKRYIKLD
ncbi:hypothetical protein N9N67_03765 [Bacteriovoracaceae bacterium]|nr:hypothetical protein [Bacteriovoracaceae bacterium]